MSDSEEKLAAKVAHDLRSPLLVFKVIEKDLELLSEEKQAMVRGAINRIREIANALSKNERHETKSDSFDVILIDDDPLVHLAWRLSAKQNGKNLISFAQTADFLKNQDSFDRSTPIYIDSSLQCGEKGEEFAQKLASLSFTNLYLATGFPAEKFGELPHVKAIVGKDAPWIY